MAIRQVAALAALACATTPSIAFETKPSSATTFFISIPLDAPSRKEQTLALGLSVQGKNYQQFSIDTQALGFALGGIEAKWVVAGGATLLAIAAAGSWDKSRQQQMQQEQQQAQQQRPPTVPCRRTC